MESKETKGFISKAIIVHGEKYSYSKIIYINCREKVEIICKKHGEFYQSPSKHLIGQGCPKCSKFRKKTPDEFKKRAEKLHKGRYDYSKTDFSHIMNKVIIICPEHGEFEQTLDKHINGGRGCIVCGGSKKKTTEEFIYEAKNVHGDKYIYDKSVYTNFESKLIITCRRHGDFLQTPHNHIINSNGCPKCVHRISKGEIEWLNYMGIPDDPEHRNVYINLGDRSIKADGYIPETNTVYEYYGDYYHGNPALFKSEHKNPHTKCSFGELYKRTLDREKNIFENGFNLIKIWENEWLLKIKDIKMKNCRNNYNLKNIVRKASQDNQEYINFNYVFDNLINGKNNFNLDLGSASSMEDISKELDILRKYMKRKGITEALSNATDKITDYAFDLEEDDELDEQFPD